MKKLMTLFAAIVAAMSMSAVTPVQKAFGDKNQVLNEAILNADTVRMKLDQQGFTCLADEVHTLVDTGYLAFVNNTTLTLVKGAELANDLNEKVAAIKVLKDSIIALHDTAEFTLGVFTTNTLTHGSSVTDYRAALQAVVGDTEGKVNLGTDYDYWKGQCYEFYKDTVMSIINAINEEHTKDFDLCKAAAEVSKDSALTFVDSIAKKNNLYWYAEGKDGRDSFKAAYDTIKHILDDTTAVFASTVDNYTALHTWHENVNTLVTAAIVMDYDTVLALINKEFSNAQSFIGEYSTCEVTYYNTVTDSLNSWANEYTAKKTQYSMATYANNKALYDFYLDVKARIEGITDVTSTGNLYETIHGYAVDTFQWEMTESRAFYTLHRMGICNLDEYRELWDTYQKYDTLQHIDTCQAQLDAMRHDIVAKRNYLDSIYNVWAAADSTLNAVIARAENVVANMTCYPDSLLAAEITNMKGLAVILEDTTVNYCFADTMNLDSLNTLIAALETKTVKDSLLDVLCLTISDKKYDHYYMIEVIVAADSIYAKGEENTEDAIKGAIDAIIYHHDYLKNQEKMVELPASALVNEVEEENALYVNYTINELSSVYCLLLFSKAQGADAPTRGVAPTPATKVMVVAEYGKDAELDVPATVDSIKLEYYNLAYVDTAVVMNHPTAPLRDIIDMDSDYDHKADVYRRFVSIPVGKIIYKAQSQQNGVATGIQNIMNGTAAAGIYTIEGIRINELQKGVNIIVKEDGTFSKKLVF